MQKGKAKKQIIENIISLSALQAANYLLPLIAFPYLVRVLGVDNFGLVAFSQAIIMYFNIIVDYGFNLSATKEVAIAREDPCKLSTIFNNVLALKLILTMIMFLCFSFIIYIIPRTSEFFEMYLMGFTIVLGQALFPTWFFQGMEKMKYITYINIITKSLFLIAIFVFIRDESDYQYVLLINGIGGIVAGLISIVIAYKYFNISLSFPTVKKMWQQLKQGWDLFIATSFGAIYRNANIVILGFFASNEVIGYYTIAERLVKTVQSLQSPVGQAFYPYLSKKKHNDPTFKFHQRYLSRVLLLYFLIGFLLFIGASSITSLITGKEIIEVTLNLKILSLLVIIGGLNYYYGVLGLVTMGRQKEFSRGVVIAGISNIPLAVTLIYLYGDIGASISLIISEAILLLVISKHIRKL